MHVDRTTLYKLLFRIIMTNNLAQLASTLSTRAVVICIFFITFARLNIKLFHSTFIIKAIKQKYYI